MQTLQDYISANELDWWLRKATQASVRKLIKQNTGVKIPRTREESRTFFSENFQIYKKWKRKPRSSNLDLDNNGWNRLGSAVISLQSRIYKIGIASALQIVLTKVSTNEKLLKGLPKRLHYWE